MNLDHPSPPAATGAPMLSQCQSCGGEVPIILSRPDSVCPYCGQVNSLSAEVERKVRRLGEKLKMRSGREDQLIGRQVKLIRSNPISLLVPMMIIWLFIGGWLLFAFKPPDEIGFRSFLLEARQPAEEFDKTTASWWLYWSIALGIGLTVTLKGAAQINLRRLVEFVLPMEPVSPEKPPRCRRCGAELPAGGAVRRCQYCQADHIVMGERYQRLEKSLDQALNQMERKLEVSLAVKAKRADRVLSLGGVLPIFLAAAGLPVGLFLGGTRPLLWIIPAALWLTGPVLYCIAATMDVPLITRSVTDWVVADELIIDKKNSYFVTSGLLFGPDSQKIQGKAACLSRSDQAEPKRAVHFPSTADAREVVYYKVKSGGRPFAQGSEEEKDLEAVDVLPGSRGPLDVQDRFWLSCKSSPRQGGHDFMIQEIRIFTSQNPQPDDRPLITFYSPQVFPLKRLSLG